MYQGSRLSWQRDYDSRRDDRCLHLNGAVTGGELHSGMGPRWKGFQKHDENVEARFPTAHHQTCQTDIGLGCICHLHNRNGIRTASWIWRADQSPRSRTKCVRFSTLNHDKLCLFKATEPRCLIFNQPTSLMPTNVIDPRADQPRFDGWSQ